MPRSLVAVEIFSPFTADNVICPGTYFSDSAISFRRLAGNCNDGDSVGSHCNRIIGRAERRLDGKFARLEERGPISALTIRK